jgi:hypothetical protein
MRTIIVLLILFSLPVSAQKQAGLTDSSLIIINVSQTRGPIPITFKTNYTFPDNDIFTYSGQCTQKKSCQFFVKHRYPILFKCFNGRKNFTGLLMPSDTLNIFMTGGKPEQQIITFNGKSALYCNYYIKLMEDTIFQKLNKAALFPDKDIQKSFSEINTTSTYHKTFLQEYLKHNVFPKWFVKFEEMQIIYDDALQKLRAFSLFNLNHEKKIFLTPQHLVWISDVPIDNTEALQTASYYDFLQTYFSLFQGGLDNSGISSKIFRHFLQTLPDVRKQLKSEVYDYYMSYSLLGYYKNASIDKAIDSLVVSLKPEFRNANTYQLLLKTKDKHFK